MKKLIKTRNVIFLISFFIILIPAVSQAVKGSVSPSTALPGQIVTVNASWIISDTGSECTATADFGDGAILTVPCTNIAGTTCSGSVQHAYSSPGNYQIILDTSSCPSDSPNNIVLFVTINSNVSIKVSPPSFRVPRGSGGSQPLSYTAKTSFPVDMELRSTEGIFLAKGQEIGRLNTPLLISVNNGIGHASETVTFPVAVLKRAERIGTTKIRFRRTFTNTNNSVTVTTEAEMIVTTEAGTELRITRMQLYFGNRRAEITVKRNDPSLKAYVDIRFTGSGLLEGYWEVDGRVLTHVKRHLVYGRSVTLETPDSPPLPTFDTGTHMLRFVLIRPDNIPVPEAIYFVTTDEFTRTLSISLISPEDKAEVEYLPPRFTWKGPGEVSVYLIEFYEAEKEKPIFSAYTRKEEYTVPSGIFEKIFQPGKRYRWQVKGFGRSDVLTGKSRGREFTFSSPMTFLPGQVLVVTSDSANKGLINGLMEKYNLSLLRTFMIKSLGYRVDVLKTDQDVMKLIKKISEEKGVIQTQPNYIFRTMTEPMSDLQSIRKILNLDSLHNHYHLRGKGVLVAIIDTGVDPNHEDLKKNLRGTKNMLPDSPYRPEIHGTAMAGIIAATINNFGIEGIAPEAGIIAIRACRQVSEEASMGECYSSTLAEAIDTAIQSGAKVVNLSIGSSVPDGLVVKVLEKGDSLGTIFVAPAGNRPYQTGLVFPASHPSVVAVGGIDAKGDCFPNESVVKKSDAVAPSDNILTTVPGGRHNFISGTSVSSAIVSGLIAVASEKNQDITRRSLPPRQRDICKWEEGLLGMKVCQ